MCVEIFAWGKYGGFGRVTRTVGRELVKAGVEVYAIVPRQQGQAEVEKLDGMTVLGYSKKNPFEAIRLVRKVNADIYHSLEPSLVTYLAMKLMPSKKHLITFQDPRNLQDWKIEFSYPAISRMQVISNFIFEHNFLVTRSVHKADAVYSMAKYLVPKIKALYKLRYDPVFLATPVTIPSVIHKAAEPTVGYLARWDKVKRPQLFMELASQFPNVKFIAAGHSRNRRWDQYLRDKYRNIPNLEMPGFIDQFKTNKHDEILQKCWIMVNTSAKEALPNAFLEASAYKCAILAGLNPDNFSSDFGYYVTNHDWNKGLAFLLENGRWKERGEMGHAYVKETFETNVAVREHLAVYNYYMTADRTQKQTFVPRDTK